MLSGELTFHIVEIMLCCVFDLLKVSLLTVTISRTLKSFSTGFDTKYAGRNVEFSVYLKDTSTEGAQGSNHQPCN